VEKWDLRRRRENVFAAGKAWGRLIGPKVIKLRDAAFGSRLREMKLHSERFPDAGHL